MMSCIKSRNTRPELFVRKLFRELGFSGYRLHRKDLPGQPDLAFIGKRKVIFVHGCFWHSHSCKTGARRPETNKDYWAAKISRNIERDKSHNEELIKLGWEILIIWECELKERDILAEKIKQFMA